MAAWLASDGAAEQRRCTVDLLERCHRSTKRRGGSGGIGKWSTNVTCISSGVVYMRAHEVMSRARAG